MVVGNVLCYIHYVDTYILSLLGLFYISTVKKIYQRIINQKPMKRLCSLLLLLPLSVLAKNKQQDKEVPQRKYEIGLLGGKALDVNENFKFLGAPFSRVALTGIDVYRNMGRNQVGLGTDIELWNYGVGTNKYIKYFSPHARFNRTLELNDLNLYAGVSLGYTWYDLYDHSGGLVVTDISESGKGLKAGVQAGVLFKITQLVAINFESGIVVRDMHIINTTTFSGNVTGLAPGEKSVKVQDFRRSTFYIPLMVGLRFRF